MTRVVVLMLCCCLANPAIARGSGEHQSASSSPVETRAWAFIEGVAAIGFAEFRRRYGSEPLSREVRAAILATLPAQGALVPTRAERTKLADHQAGGQQDQEPDEHLQHQQRGSPVARPGTLVKVGAPTQHVC